MPSDQRPGNPNPPIEYRNLDLPTQAVNTVLLQNHGGEFVLIFLEKIVHPPLEFLPSGQPVPSERKHFEAKARLMLSPQRLVELHQLIGQQLEKIRNAMN